MSDGDDLRRGDPVLISALAAGATHADAAAQAGVSVATVTRRLREPAFRAEVLKARAELVHRAVGVLSDACVAASTTLVELLSSRHDGIRLASARCILEQAVRLRDAADLEARVIQLEEVAQTVAAGRELRAVQ